MGQMKGNDQEMALCLQVKIGLRTLIGCQCLQDTGTGVAACMQKVNTPRTAAQKAEKLQAFNLLSRYTHGWHKNITSTRLLNITKAAWVDSLICR